LASAYVLRPCNTCVLIFQRTKRQRDRGPTKVGVARRQRRQRRIEGSSQEVFKMIFKLRDNPLSVQSTYTLDMYSNQEAEERHSGDVAKSLQMTNR